MFVLFFWETGLFVLYFCLMNNCSDGSDEVSFFSFLISGRFFKLNRGLPAIYCDKNPQVVFILFQRLIFCFWSVMPLRFDDFFLSSCTMYLKMFFFFFYSGTSGNGSTIFKTGNDIYDFSSDEQQCRFKERFRIHLVAQFIVFLFFLFMFV